jgi:hypothetical protein
MLLYARAALPGVPLLHRRGDSIPDTELVRDDVHVDRDRLAAYARVCGFTLRDTLPPTYPHVLAFPLHLQLMADGAFPFGGVGLVHIANRIVQHRPLALAEPLELRVHAGELEPHRRGRTFTIVSETRVDGELVWEGASMMLKRGDGSEDAPREPREEPPPVSAHWRLEGDLGRRYASVSGDRNPIHMHGLAAKALGFPRAIVHGMWTKAHCLAALRLPDAFTAEVHFRKPILLPSTVTFGAAEDRFAVHDHLDGHLRTP